MNQHPEQQARNHIDRLLQASGRIVQSKEQLNLSADAGVAIREYLTDLGPADYVLFVDRKPVGLIVAKREEEGLRLTVVEEQSHDYATARLKHLHNEPLRFVYETTGELTHFTDFKDPRPRSRHVFTFQRPETFRAWFHQKRFLLSRFSMADKLEEPIAQGLQQEEALGQSILKKAFNGELLS